MALISLIFSLFILIPSTDGVCISKNNAFDKKAYYNTFASDNVDVVNTELKSLKSNTSLSAFEGALLMKKAALVGNPKDKLSLMKEGKTKLEAAIAKNPTHTEYLFLRYMIQDNAPSFLGYNTNLEDDKKKIIAAFPTFDQELKDAIMSYTKKSKTLSPDQF